MKTTQIIPILMLLCFLFSCKKIDNNDVVHKYAITCLTNDSIKYWESYPPIQNSQQGYYFCKDGTCDEFEIDQTKRRLFIANDDILWIKPLHFELKKDTLLITSGGTLYRCYKIIKFSKRILVLKQTDNFSLLSGEIEKITAINEFYPAKDQQTKPSW